MLESLGEVGTYPLCGRQGVCIFRMLRLQDLKFLHQHVELAVSNLRGIEYIIIMIMPVELTPELFYSFLCLHILINVWISYIPEKEGLRGH